jgi:hypothetical protein
MSWCEVKSHYADRARIVSPTATSELRCTSVGISCSVNISDAMMDHAAAIRSDAAADDGLQLRRGIFVAVGGVIPAELSFRQRVQDRERGDEDPNE